MVPSKSVEISAVHIMFSHGLVTLRKYTTKLAENLSYSRISENSLYENVRIYIPIRHNLYIKNEIQV